MVTRRSGEERSLRHPGSKVLAVHQKRRTDFWICLGCWHGDVEGGEVSLSSISRAVVIPKRGYAC